MSFWLHMLFTWKVFLRVGKGENEFLDVCMEMYGAVTRLLSWKVKTIYERQSRFPFILEYKAEKIFEAS